MLFLINPAGCCFALLNILLIHHDLSAATAQSPPGFLSIDCGSSRTSNYTDVSGIEWVPDGVIWPDIGGWSKTAIVPQPDYDMVGDGEDEKYQTLRYFPPELSNASNATKFCYALPAIGEQFYLIRATFWYGQYQTASLYNTRAPDAIMFRMIVDSYAGALINVTLPQNSPLTEEMYVRAQSGRTSISVCFSAADSDGGTSDAPFISGLELRPLPSNLTSVAVLNKTNTALRRVARKDFGSTLRRFRPSITRYPDDMLDRLWDSTEKYGGTGGSTAEEILNLGCSDFAPASVLQTFYGANSNVGWYYAVDTGTDNTGDDIESTDARFNYVDPTSYPPPTPAAGPPHRYYVALFFGELQPGVINATGQRVFDITINGESFRSAVDVYKEVGLNTAYEISSDTAQGPYTSIIINGTATATSVFPPFIAAAEILQLLDDPMAPPTFPADVVGIQAIKSTFSDQLARFTGDPCLPVAYPYPWLNCTRQDIVPTRVLSISLSNSNLSGNVPPSITNLDQLVRISFDGNALEGSLPSGLSSLLNLQFLNLSNNKLNGSIPDSLGQLTRLTYLDLRNNNFTGEIPLSLQQKARKGQLDLRYDGNPFLCLSGNATYAASYTPSPSKILLIVVSAVGAAVVCLGISILITCIIRNKRIKENPSSSSNNNESVHPYASQQVLSNTRMVEAANTSQAFTYEDIVAATGNFSTILGRGGFGTVYKGTLKNGTIDVAVKVLSDASQQSAQQFLTEVTILSRVHHKNLVRLLGYCNKKKLILVYEYMPNGSLYDCLFHNSSLALETPLTWIQRLQIMLDAAQGLAYLHGSCEPRIIHMDVKSSNILLTKTLEGKVSDFGISTQNSGADGDGAQHLTMTLVASRGYTDPEFATTLEWSERVDVYSFGVVLLEVMSGRQPLLKDPEYPNVDSIHIVEWARDHYERGAIERILFNGIGDYNESAVWKVAEIATACVQNEGLNRPTMDEVCTELSDALRLEMGYNTTTLYASTIDTEVQQLPIPDQVYLR